MFSTTHPEHFNQMAQYNRQQLIMADIVDILNELDGMAFDYEIYSKLHDKWAEYETDCFIALGRLVSERWAYIVRKRERLY